VTADANKVQTSEVIAADATLSAQRALPFVSRGGVKLRAPAEQYPIEIEETMLSTSRIDRRLTEVLLSNGASLVFAIDVGHGQLHPLAARPPPKSLSMEETDIRKLGGKRCRARPTSS